MSDPTATVSTRTTTQHPASTRRGAVCSQRFVPGERIVYTSTLSTETDLWTVSLTTVEFAPGEDGGTRLVLTEQGTFLDGHEQPAWREHGTADQLEALAAQLKTELKADG
jgi:uncharacterized protein YndB with AHSA1/START domain